MPVLHALALAAENGGGVDKTWMLQVMGGIVSVGTVQLVIYLLRRKSDMKALDRTSGASLLTGASDHAAMLQAHITRLETRLDKVEENHALEKQEWQRERNRLIQQLNLANEEIVRLQGINVRQQTELNIATRQNQELQRLLDLARGSR